MIVSFSTETLAISILSLYSKLYSTELASNENDTQLSITYQNYHLNTFEQIQTLLDHLCNTDEFENSIQLIAKYYDLNTKEIKIPKFKGAHYLITVKNNVQGHKSKAYPKQLLIKESHFRHFKNFDSPEIEYSSN